MNEGNFAEGDYIPFEENFGKQDQIGEVFPPATQNIENDFNVSPQFPPEMGGGHHRHHHRHHHHKTQNPPFPVENLPHYDTPKPLVGEPLQDFSPNASANYAFSAEHYHDFGNLKEASPNYVPKSSSNSYAKEYSKPPQKYSFKGTSADFDPILDQKKPVQSDVFPVNYRDVPINV